MGVDKLRRIGTGVIGTVFSAAVSACATLPGGVRVNDWVADYDTAEAQVRETNRALFIYYKDVRPGKRDRLRALLADPSVDQRIEGFVRCTLFRSHEPDRRYVAQFGIERAPALILLHADGTYHARAGLFDKEEILDFLAQAQPPGARPDWDPHIPREPAYQWHDDLASAQNEAEHSRRPILVVFHRRLSRDWRSLKELLHTHEVYSRAANLVHCRVQTWPSLDNRYFSPFGPIALPSVAIVHPDGAHAVSELPTSSAALARFLDRNRESVTSAVSPAASRAGSEAGSR